MKQDLKLIIGVWLGVLALCSPVRAQEAAVPAEFNYVGSYLLEKRIKVRGGEVFKVATKPLEYRVFTDGITVKLYGGNDDGGFIRYEVYRSEGMLEAPNRFTIETVAGLQAKSSPGGILRSITLTKRQLMITTHPAVSGVVEIIYARRVADEASFNQVNQAIE